MKNNADALVFHTAICDVLGMENNYERKRYHIRENRNRYHGAGEVSGAVFSVRNPNEGRQYGLAGVFTDEW